MRVILIAGKAGSGKSYLGSCLVEFAKSRGLRVLQTEYSKYVKLYAREILGYDGKRENKPRTFLQETGVFLRKQFGEDFFVKRMLEDFSVYENYVDLVVISDVRLKQEIEEFKKGKYKDVLTIQVKNNNGSRLLTEVEKQHVTETELDEYRGFDYVISNKSKEEIETFAKECIEGER